MDFLKASEGVVNPKDLKVMRDIHSGKKHGVFFKTSDVAAVCDLMYGFRDLVNEVCFVFNKKGVKLGESACADNLFLFGNFPAKRFTHYCCNPRPVGEKLTDKGGEGDWDDEEEDDKVVVAFEPRKVNSLLNNHQQRDTMIWLYDETKPDTLIILRYPHEDGYMESRYEMKLLQMEETGYRAPKKDIDYVLVLNSTTITKFINGFTSLSHEFQEDWVTIECGPNSVEFKMEGGCQIAHSVFTLVTKKDGAGPQKPRRSRTQQESGYTNDDDVEITTEEPVIARKYRLMHLNQLLKCFSITRNGIMLYIFKDYPIIFEIRIGGLGELRAALLFKDEEEEGENDDDEPPSKRTREE